jgi:hypothetical protein
VRQDQGLEAHRHQIRPMRPHLPIPILIAATCCYWLD